jgi:hypothetical protein
MKYFYSLKHVLFACLFIMQFYCFGQNPPPDHPPPVWPCCDYCTAPSINALYDYESSKEICLDEYYNLTASISGGEYCTDGDWEFAWYTGTGNDSTYWNGSTWDNPVDGDNVWDIDYEELWDISPTETTTYKVKVRCSLDTT